MNNKKILIITYYWPPSGGAGVQRWLKFAKYLPEFGWEPLVLTVDEKYASYMQTDFTLNDDVRPDTKIYKTKSFEALNVLSSIAGKKNVPYGGFSNVNKTSFLQTILRFIRGNFFIPDARIGWNKYAYKKAVQIIKEQNISTVITTSPPHSTQLIGLKLKQKLKITWIADLRDPWTDIYFYKDLLHTKFAKSLDKRMEIKVLKNADKVITNCQSNKKLLSSKLEASMVNKFHVITNGFDEEDFTGKQVNPNEFTITYSGTIAANYEPEVFLNALAVVVNKHPTINFKLKMVGNVAPEIEKLISEVGLSQIYDPVGYVPHHVLIKHLISSTVLFYIFPKTDNDKGIAGKLFEYLAAKKIIIGIGPSDGDSAKIIEECGVGKMFERDELDGLSLYMDDLVKSWLASSTVQVDSHKIEKYSRKNLTNSLSKILNS